MSDHANDGHDDLDSAAAETQELGMPTPVDSVEAYDTDDGVVFYDAENPLAWLKAASALTLKECA